MRHGVRVLVSSLLFLVCRCIAADAEAPAVSWSDAASKFSPPVYSTVTEHIQIPYGKPTKDPVSNRIAKEAIDCINLRLSPIESYDPTSVDWGHYVRYNFLIFELVKHRNIPVAQGKAEIAENEAKSRLLYNHSINGLDPAIVAKWAPTIRTSSGSQFDSSLKRFLTVHWGDPGSDQEKTVELELSEEPPALPLPKSVEFQLSKPASVRLAGQTVIEIFVGSGGLSPVDRAQQIQRNLDNALVAAKDRSPRSVRIVYVRGMPVITLGGYQVLTVDEVNAKAEGTSPGLLAQKWSDALRSSLTDVVGTQSYVNQLSGGVSP